MSVGCRCLGVWVGVGVSYRVDLYFWKLVL